MKGFKFLFIAIFAFAISSCDKDTTYECTCYSVLTPNNGGAGTTYSESRLITVTSKAVAQSECDMAKAEKVESYKSIPDSSATVSCDLIKE